MQVLPLNKLSISTSQGLQLSLESTSRHQPGLSYNSGKSYLLCISSSLGINPRKYCTKNINCPNKSKWNKQRYNKMIKGSAKNEKSVIICPSCLFILLWSTNQIELVIVLHAITLNVLIFSSFKNTYKSIEKVCNHNNINGCIDYS